MIAPRPFPETRRNVTATPSAAHPYSGILGRLRASRNHYSYFRTNFPMGTAPRPPWRRTRPTQSRISRCTAQQNRSPEHGRILLLKSSSSPLEKFSKVREELTANSLVDSDGVGGPEISARWPIDHRANPPVRPKSRHRCGMHVIDEVRRAKFLASNAESEAHTMRDSRCCRAVSSRAGGEEDRNQTNA